MNTRRLEADNIKRVVVQGATWVGDAAMTVPALKRLRQLLPTSHITLATRSWSTGIFTESDFVDDLLIQSTEGRKPGPLLHQVREWKRLEFDLAVILPNAFAPALVAFLAGVRSRVGHSTQGRGLLLSHPVRLPAWRTEKHEIFYYLNIIDRLEGFLSGKVGATSTYQPDPRIHLSEASKIQAQRFLAGHGLADGQTLIIICPGSINSRAKRWPVERYAALADMFLEDPNTSVALIGSDAELDVSLDVQRLMSRQPIMLTGQTDLRQVAGILDTADLLVTNDTGPAHIGSALNCPTLVIFGPTNPATTRPFSSASEVIRKPPACAPCMLRDCPIDHRCMTAILPGEVFARARLLMKRTQGQALAS